MSAPMISRMQAEQMFFNLDKTGDGVVSPRELIEFLKKNYNVTEEDAVKMFSDVDIDESRTITIDEFVDQVCAKPNRQGFEDAFSKVDKDQSGTIVMEEFLEFAENGPIKDTETLKQIFKAADTDGSGKISKEEFMIAVNEY